MEGSTVVAAVMLGLATGAVSSWVTWWLIHHRFRARVEFSPRIARGTDQSGRHTYRVKLRNVGWRGLVDVSFECYWVVRGLNPEHPDNWVSVPIPITTSDHGPPQAARLDRSVHRGNRNVPKQESPPRFKRHRILRIKPEGIDPTRLPPRITSEAVKNNVAANSATLEDLLGEGGQLTFVVKGYDSYGGGRVVLLTPDGYYTRDKIREGTFELFTLQVAGADGGA